MLQELEKIIDVNSFKNFIEPQFKGINSLEDLLLKASSIKLLDFFQNAFQPEYNLQEIWHKDEIAQIQRKLERCVTINQKKSYLESKLNEQEILFEEHEYFEMIEDLKDANFMELIRKITPIKNGIKKTSRWLESNEDERAFLSLIEEIPNQLPSIDVLNTLTLQKIRGYILSRPALYNMFQKFMRFKRGEISPSKLLLDIISDIFSIHYAIKLNIYLRKEYQKLLPKNEYQLVEVVEEQNQQEGKKTEIGFPKIKQRIANDGITSLSVNQTALFFNMLREKKIIFKDESYQSKENIYKAIQVLTGYNKQNIKTAMSLREYEQSDKDVVQNIIKNIKF